MQNTLKKETIEQFRVALSTSEFIAIDTELTGLHRNTQSQNDNLDSTHKRYSKYRDSARHFIPTQIGICTYRWDEENCSYVACPFNFYLYPRSSRKLGIERTFVVQASSFEFLQNFGFDFEKWIKTGLSYLSKEEENQVRSRFGSLASSNPEDITITDNNREFVEDFIGKSEIWMQTSSEETFVIQAPSSYHRRLVHQEIRK
ncbi:hypothetical protein HK096_001752, partial [Nowakowskiella sp. JEL0078]